MSSDAIKKAKERAAKAAQKRENASKSSEAGGPAKAVATPCRRKLSGEFSKVSSQESLEKKGSSVSMGSTDRKAVFHRDRTIDQFRNSPAEVPNSTPRYRHSQKSGEAPVMEKTQKETNKDQKGETSKQDVEDKTQDTKKGHDHGEGGKDEKKSTPATRTRDYLKQQKKEEKVCPKENKPKEKADKKDDQAKAKAKAKVEPKNDKKKDKEPKKEVAVKSHADDDDDDDGKKNVTEEEKSKAHAMYMKFWRSMQSRTTPKEVKKVYSRFKHCKEQTSMLYEDFFSCGGDWKKSTIYKSITNSFTNRKTGKRKWLTKKQMLPYFDDDQSVVDAVVLRKKTDPELSKVEIRDHPENPKLKQYLVLVEDEEVATESEKIADKFLLKDKSGSGKRRRKDDSEDDSSSDDSGSGGSSDKDDDSSDSSSKATKVKSKKKGKKGKVDKNNDKSDSKAAAERSEKKNKKKKSKKSKKKKTKAKKTPEEEAKEAAKEAQRKIIKDVKKAIADINGRIRAANEKKTSMQHWTPNMRSAIEKEMNGLSAGLVSIRGKLQDALDSGAKESKLQKELEMALAGLQDYDLKMEPITGKKRKAEKHEPSDSKATKKK